MMKKHELKILPIYFQAQLEGKKNFEIRKNDRNYNVGDLLLLEEYNPETQEFTGREIAVKVTYITDYQQRDGYVVLGTKPDYSVAW